MRARLSTGTPRAGAVRVKQIGKLVRFARARRPPQLERRLLGAPASCAPRRRGRTCRTRRSTFLKAVQPPYVAQCPRGLPAADQWLSARLPFHSAARRLRPRRVSDCSAAGSPRASAHAAPVGVLWASQPCPPSSFLFSGSPLSFPSPFSFSFFTLSPPRSVLPTQPRQLLFAFLSFLVSLGAPTAESPTGKTCAAVPQAGQGLLYNTETKREASGGVHEIRRTGVPGQRGNSKLKTPMKHVILCATLGRTAKIQKVR